MRSKLYFSVTLGALVLSLLVTGMRTRPATAAGPKEAKKPAAQSEPTKITITPIGPTATEFENAKAAIERNSQVQRLLAGNNYRLLSFTLLDGEQRDRKASAPGRYQAIYYDYTNERSITAESPANDLSSATVSTSNYQPTPTFEEFQDAVRILTTDDHFGPLIKDGSLTTFRPMPPVVEATDALTKVERTVHVGLGLRDAGPTEARNEVVGVRMAKATVLRYANGAPPSCAAAPEACGVANAGQSTVTSGTGSYHLVVTQGPNTLWDMTVVRPTASSGTRKSGIEVQNVLYKGKSVLKRGHAPVLNVKYTSDTCGPYRDWQFEEGQFQTPLGSTDPAPGIRLCPTPASTELENGTDAGNFNGVAVYTNQNGTPADTSDDETVLLTELEAGWYRYIMEWRFANNGIIRPRFGFGAVSNNCVCNVHTHHVYWRFDFDVVTPSNRVFLMERGKKFSNAILTEGKVSRNYGTTRSILVQNVEGDEGYLLVPNINDGTRGGIDDAFGVGDIWLLSYKNIAGGSALQNEFDDGTTCINCTDAAARIKIDTFLNGESVNNADVVVWYGASFVHSDGAGIIDPDRSLTNLLTGPHVVGPDLRPRRW